MDSDWRLEFRLNKKCINFHSNLHYLLQVLPSVRNCRSTISIDEKSFITYKICKEIDLLQVDIKNSTFQQTSEQPSKRMQEDFEFDVIGNIKEVYKINERSEFVRNIPLRFDSTNVYRILKLFGDIQNCLMEEKAHSDKCKQIREKLVVTENNEMELHLKESTSGTYIYDHDEGIKRVRRNTDWCPPRFICHGRTNVTKLYPQKYSKTIVNNEQTMKPPTRLSLKIKRVHTASLKTLVQDYSSKKMKAATKLVVRYHSKIFGGIRRQRRDTHHRQQYNDAAYIKLIFTSLEQSLRKVIKIF